MQPKFRENEEIIFWPFRIVADTGQANCHLKNSAVSASYIREDGALDIEKVIRKFQEFIKEQYGTKGDGKARGMGKDRETRQRDLCRLGLTLSKAQGTGERESSVGFSVPRGSNNILDLTFILILPIISL